MRNSFLGWGLYALFLSSLLACQGSFPEEDTTGKSLFTLKFGAEIDSLRKANALPAASAAYEYTYIGDYEGASKSYDLPVEWGMEEILPSDADVVDTWEVLDPFEYIQQLAEHKEIVILSEAHHKPQHRVFTRELLKVLYDDGFRYLGLETLMPSYGPPGEHWLMDTLLEERGYCLNMPVTGYYTREPQMANLVRTAIDLGYTLFAYEKTQQDDPRDLAQAKNIKRFLDQKGRGKTVIHCGWYHAVETGLVKRKDENWMAYHLKNLTALDPITVYMDALTEKRNKAPAPIFELLKEKVDKPSVFLETSGKAFSGRFGKQYVDMFLYFPPTKYKNGRPDWLFWPEENRAVKVDHRKFSNLAYPVRLKAFRWSEGNLSVPYDIIELKGPDDPQSLVLKRGKYQIEASNPTGEMVRFVLRV